MKSILVTTLQSLDPRDPGDRAARLLLFRASLLAAEPIKHDYLCGDLRDYTDPENGFSGEIRPDLLGKPWDAAPFFEPEAVQAGLERLQQLKWLEPFDGYPDFSTPHQLLKSCRPPFDPEMVNRELSAIVLNLLKQSEIAFEQEEVSILDGLIPHLGSLAESFKPHAQKFSPMLSLYYGWAVSFYGEYDLALEHLGIASTKGQELCEEFDFFPCIAYGQYMMTLARAGYCGQAYEKFLPFLEKLPPYNHAEYGEPRALARIWRNAGSVARAMNEFDRAELYLRKSLEGLQAFYGPFHERTGLTEATLLLVLAAGSDPAAVEPHLRAVLQTIRANRDQRSSATMAMQVGETYVILKRYAEAEAALRDALVLVHEHCGSESSLITEGEQLLATIAEETKPKAAAAKTGWFQKMFQKS